VTSAGAAWQIRPYVEDDQPGIEQLLDTDADRLWVGQGHRLHGAALTGERWRRTLIAEVAGDVAGAATITTNRVHPDRYNLAVEVGPGRRGRGLGRVLVDRVRRLAPEPRPLAAKLRPSDLAGAALLRRFGGRVYQRCPGWCPDPTSPEVRAWATGITRAADAAVLPLDELARTEWPELWVRQYLWVHEHWSPAAPGPLRELAPDLVAGADPELSTIIVRGEHVDAVTWVFDAHDGTAEVVAETTQPQAPAGVSDVAAGLARTMLALGDRAVRKAEIDGHVSDPHLGPVLEGFPAGLREPLYLVEIPPGRSEMSVDHVD
jgi:hypothetical protein